MDWWANRITTKQLMTSRLRFEHNDCAECHVVTIRFDWANGCDSSKNAYRGPRIDFTRVGLDIAKGTSVMVVNSSQSYRWEPISWGWLKLGGTSSEPLVAQAHKIDTRRKPCEALHPSWT